MDAVQKFILENQYQLGYIMHEASNQWIKNDPVGALTVGDCNFVINKYGKYHVLLEKIEQLEKQKKAHRIFRVAHTDMMGSVIWEEFFDSKNKAKKALRKKFKELKPIMEKEEPTHLSEPLMHKKQLNFMKKSTRCFELMFEVWHKCSYEYDEWDTYVEGLHIDLIQVN